jgi:hypothetical protein
MPRGLRKVFLEFSGLIYGDSDVGFAAFWCIYGGRPNRFFFARDAGKIVAGGEISANDFSCCLVYDLPFVVKEVGFFCGGFEIKVV